MDVLSIIGLALAVGVVCFAGGFLGGTLFGQAISKEPVGEPR